MTAPNAVLPDTEKPAAGIFEGGAPVVSSADNAGEVAALKSYVRELEGITSHNAKKESERLGAYFNYLSNYVRVPLDELKNKYIFPGSKSLSSENAEYFRVREKLVEPGVLKELFNAATRFTGNTLLSEVVLLPRSLCQDAAVMGKDFADQLRFSVRYEHAFGKFTFGFHQVFENGSLRRAMGSTTFSFMGLDDKRLADIKDHAPQKMLRHLQSVMTAVNHDPLHHYTVLMLNRSYEQAVAYGFAPSFHGKKFEDWRSISLNYVDPPENTRYESWAQVAHERMAFLPGNEGMTAEISRDVSSYFDELGRMKPTHETVSYFGMVMAHSLSRLFPLNHPVMQDCLARIEQCDPEPQKMIDRYKDHHGGSWVKPGVPQRIMEAYQNHCPGLMCGEGASYNYRQLLQTELLNCADLEMHPHVPPDACGISKNIRRYADKATLEMFVTLADIINFKPA